MRYASSFGISFWLVVFAVLAAGPTGCEGTDTPVCFKRKVTAEDGSSYCGEKCWTTASEAENACESDETCVEFQGDAPAAADGVCVGTDWACRTSGPLGRPGVDCTGTSSGSGGMGDDTTRSRDDGEEDDSSGETSKDCYELDACTNVCGLYEEPLSGIGCELPDGSTGSSISGGQCADTVSINGHITCESGAESCTCPAPIEKPDCQMNGVEGTPKIWCMEPCEYHTFCVYPSD